MFTQTSTIYRTAMTEPVATVPSSGRDEVVVTLLAIAKATRALVGVELSSIGLHQGQDELLMALEPDKPAPVSALAEILCVRPSTVSKMLDRLVLKGLVERVSSGRDARVTLVKVTPKGAALKRDILQVWSRIQTCVDEKLKDRDADDRMRHLRSVEAALKTTLARLR